MKSGKVNHDFRTTQQRTDIFCIPTDFFYFLAGLILSLCRHLVMLLRLPYYRARKTAQYNKAAAQAKEARMVGVPQRKLIDLLLSRHVVVTFNP